MNKPIRVVQVIGSLSRGGIETWLMEVARNYHGKGEIEIDFLVHTDEESHMDEEARALGCRILVCQGHKNPLAYSQRLTKLLVENGPYDVIHSHIHFMSGMVLRAAKKAGIPMRIAHSHNTLGSDPDLPYIRKFYQRTMRHLIDANCTHGFGCSGLAGQNLFGENLERSAKYCTYYAGVHMEPFEQEYNRQALLEELDLPENAFVVGHVAGFRPQKNHPYLIRIGEELCALRDDAYLVMVSDGPELDRIKQYAAASPFANRFRFTGSLPSAVPLMKGAFDVFVLPSFHEGLPHVGLEAQAAGLPTIFSDRITKEVAVIPELTEYLSIDLPARAWAERIDVISKQESPSRQEALAIMQKSPFNIKTAMKKLYQYYSQQPIELERTAIAA